MSLHLLILHRRELTFSYEICLPASGNDQNRVLMMIPFEESTLVRYLGGCVLKSVVLQSDLKSLWLIYLASCKILDKSSRALCPAAREDCRKRELRCGFYGKSEFSVTGGVPRQ